MTNTIKALKALDEAGKLATQGEWGTDNDAIYCEDTKEPRFIIQDENYGVWLHNGSEDGGKEEIKSTADFIALAANSRDAIRSAIDMLEGGVGVEELKREACESVIDNYLNRLDCHARKSSQDIRKAIDHLAKDYILIKRDK